MSRALRTSGMGRVPIAYRRGRPRGRVAAGPPVLLLHGMGGDGRTWDAVSRTLRRAGRETLTADLRGHGRSGHAASYLFGEFASDVEELCAGLGLERVDLVGHSLGARTASVVAQRRPGLVRRLVLEEMPLPLDAGDPVPEVPAHRPTPTELLRAGVSLARSPRGFYAFDRAVTEPAMGQFRSPDPAWWAGLTELTMPVLFLRGTRHGSVVDPDLLRRMQGRVPHMRVREADSGHSLHRDRRRDFEGAVRAFLGERQP